MRCYFFILVIFLQADLILAQSLMPVKDGLRWGYIDTSGKKMIKPAYREAHWFCEGLAVVRKNGSYGYIDPKNNYVIPDIYDYAQNFQGNFAMVFKNGRALIIDKKGNTAFLPASNEEIRSRNNNVLEVSRDSANVGLFDLTSAKWIIEPAYANISFVDDSIYAVSKDVLIEKEKARTTAIFILTPAGLKQVCDFITVRGIERGADGEVILNYGVGDKDRMMIINRKGEIVFDRRAPNNSFFDDSYSEGLVIVQFHKGIQHIEYQDKQGKSIFRKMNYTSATPFCNNRALVEVNDEDWALIDKTGKILNTKRFSFCRTGFSHLEVPNIDYCLVRAENQGDCVINSNGDYMIEPIYESLELFDEKAGLFLATEEDSAAGAISDELSDLQKKLYNLSKHNGADSASNTMEQVQIKDKKDDLEKMLEMQYTVGTMVLLDHKGKKVLPSKYKVISRTAFDDLFYYQKGKEEGYIRKDGKKIWSRTYSDQNNKLDTLNIPYMERGYFYAASEEDIFESLGGWGHSDNKPIGPSNNDAFRDKKDLVIWVDTMSVDTFYRSFAGKTVYLFNGRSDTAIFDAQDSRLYMTMQALDTDGKWKDIEYSPSSWCGNSYHKVGLYPGKIWKFTAPVYGGSLRTKFRFKLIGRKNWKNDHYEYGDVIVSNEFYGSVNPGQFWRKKGHTAVSIMDPYNE